MEMSAKKRLKIDYALFVMAFDRDTDFQDAYPQRAYLDLTGGELLWVYDNDRDAQMEGLPEKENRKRRWMISSSEDRYLIIPGRSHGDHHDFLREFLDSEWTEHESTRQLARESYFGSIGGWKDKIGEQWIIDEFHKFRDDRLRKLAEEYLGENGLDPQWV